MRTTLLTLLALLFALPALAQDHADVADVLLIAWDLEEVDYPSARRQLVLDEAIDDGLLADLAESHLDVRVRTQAAIVLGWRHDAELFSAVWTARPVNDRRDVRQRFVDDVFADPDAQPAVVERILHGTDASLARAGLAMSMIRIGDDWGERILAVLSDSDDGKVREMAAWSFRHAAPESAFAGLSLGLRDTLPDVRAEAARSLGFRVDGEELAEDLVLALQDTDPAVRAASARSLGYLHVVAAAGALTAAIGDAGPDVRLNALRSLDRVDPTLSKALPGLDRLAQDPDPKVARVAERIRLR